jgi:hypothetical protein
MVPRVSMRCCGWVARLMRAADLVGCQRRRRARITVEYPARVPAPNPVARYFAAPAPDRLWLGDITYLPTHEGWLSLAVLLDAHSRRVVGWAMADHLRTELALDALPMAGGGRGEEALRERRRPGVPIRRALVGAGCVAAAARRGEAPAAEVDEEDAPPQRDERGREERRGGRLAAPGLRVDHGDELLATHPFPLVVCVVAGALAPAGTLRSCSSAPRVW